MWVTGPHESHETGIPAVVLPSPQLTITVSLATSLLALPDIKTAFTPHFGDVLLMAVIATAFTPGVPEDKQDLISDIKKS